jgi:hypothetical protein
MKGTKGGARPGAGRPPSDKDSQFVGARVPADDLAAIDEWAVKNGCTRSEALRRLAKLGLLAEKKDG